jgi:hypothetical protein
MKLAYLAGSSLPQPFPSTAYFCGTCRIVAVGAGDFWQLGIERWRKWQEYKAVQKLQHIALAIVMFLARWLLSIMEHGGFMVEAPLYGN